MHKIVYLPLAESDLMDALGYIAYTLDAPNRGVPLRPRALPNRPPDERRDPQGAGQELRALLCRISRPRGDSPLSLRQERQKQNR